MIFLTNSQFPFTSVSGPELSLGLTALFGEPLDRWHHVTKTQWVRFGIQLGDFIELKTSGIRYPRSR